MSTQPREVLFSVTARDLVFTYSRGTGKGGQKRNKTETHVRCFHPASGAAGESDETRSQHNNKKRAFAKMAQSKKFQDWCRLEAARATGKLREIDEQVNREMRLNIRVEAKDEAGRWVPWKDRRPDEDPENHDLHPPGK